MRKQNQRLLVRRDRAQESGRRVAGYEYFVGDEHGGEVQDRKDPGGVGDKARYKLILSGTPVQNEAIDIFSQYRFLDPSIFGLNFYAFKNRYCVMGGFEQRQL